jgi:hypothetical protein
MPDTQADQHECAHPACGCKVTAGKKYCSDYCKKAPETDSIATACTLNAADDLSRLAGSRTAVAARISRDRTDNAPR